MGFEAEMRAAVMGMVKSLIKKNQRRGKAINIDQNNCVCDVDLENGVVLHKVKLKATEAANDKGIVIVPKNKSYVVAAMVEGVEADWCLVQYSEIDSAAFFFKNGGKVELKDNGEVHLNGSNFGALVKIDELVKKINALEQKHDAFVGEYNGHVHTNHGITPTVASTSLIGSQTTVADLKNDKVKHGG